MAPREFCWEESANLTFKNSDLMLAFSIPACHEWNFDNAAQKNKQHMQLHICHKALHTWRNLPTTCSLLPHDEYALQKWLYLDGMSGLLGSLTGRSAPSHSHRSFDLLCCLALLQILSRAAGRLSLALRTVFDSWFCTAWSRLFSCWLGADWLCALLLFLGRSGLSLIAGLHNLLKQHHSRKTQQYYLPMSPFITRPFLVCKPDFTLDLHISVLNTVRHLLWCFLKKAAYMNS